MTTKKKQPENRIKILIELPEEVTRKLTIQAARHLRLRKPFIEDILIEYSEKIRTE